MTRLLHIALLLCSAYAAASACKDGTLNIVEGTRCRRYAECENGSWHLKECEFGQIFDSNTLRCASVTEVGKCNDNSKCSEGRAYSYLGSTNIYFRCINGRISVQVCGAGEIFDPDLQYCRFDHAFQITRLERGKRYAACVEGNKSRDGKSCKSYTECVNGEEVKKTCSECMNFDDKTQSCRFIFLAPCGDSPTTPTPQPETTTPVPETTAPQPETTEPVPETTAPQPETTEPVPETTAPQPETTEPSTETITPHSETTPETPTSEPPCREGERIGLVDPDCKAYKECKNGVWVKDACGWWRKFDAIKKECFFTWWNKITCAQ